MFKIKEKWVVLMGATFTPSGGGFMKICGKHLGLAGGIVLGIINFILVSFGAMFGHGVGFTSLYIGLMPMVSMSLFGSIIALIYGVVGGFVWLFLLAFLYNTLHGT